VSTAVSKADRRSPFVPHDLARPIAGSDSGLLAGLTVAIKDMYDIAGERTGGGNPDWLAAQRPAARNASAVQKLLDAGATVIGKTICDEFFYSVAGVNEHYGTPVNPRAPGRIPGGSSSGSASAVAAGTCDFALGSDTGGSVRIPAAFCGVYGIRTTHGRVDATGAMAMAASFDAIGWFANGPGVLRNVGTVLLDGNAQPAAVERLLVLDDAFAEADSDVAALLRAALAAMTPALPGPQHRRIAPEGFDAWREAFRIIQAHEIWQVYGDFVTARRPQLGSGIRERMQAASQIGADELGRARDVYATARAHLREIAQPGTLLALPTAPSIAPRLDASPAELDSVRTRIMRLTCLAGLAGLPQLSIAVGTVAGCPAGLSLIGWPGGDESLLELGLSLSRYCGLEA
jgi:amidase